MGVYNTKPGRCRMGLCASSCRGVLCYRGEQRCGVCGRVEVAVSTEISSEPSQSEKRKLSIHGPIEQ